MEKDVGKIAKNDNTDIIVRVDDFGGKRGITVREFVKGGGPSGYSGFTKAGTRIPAEKFLEFREAINSISLNDLKSDASPASGAASEKKEENSAVEDY